MVKWEYKCEYLALFPQPHEKADPFLDGHRKMLQELLDRYGAEGWELVSISPGLLNGDHIDGEAIFKRKLKD